MDLPTNLGNLLMIAGIALACWLLLRTSRAGWGRSQALEADPRSVQKEFDARGRKQPFDGAPSELLQWQVEMHQTARDLKAEIDTKLSALRALTLMAREESARLEALLAQAQQLDPAAFQSLTANATLAAIEQLADDPSAVTLPSRSPAQRGEWIDRPQQKAQIARLAEQGHSAASIAAQLGLPVGEVELTMSLGAK
jgi:hypothetical protein